MQIKVNINLNNFTVNRIVKYFVLSDLFFLGGWGLINPLFAVFVMQNIPGATLFTVGALASVYWIVKALVQMPVSILLDRREGEKDDFYALIFALVLAGFTAMLFTMANSITSIFVVHFFHAIALGFYTPSWSAIFSRHLDKEKYAFDWSLDSTAIGLASGVAGITGGLIANSFGFSAVFVITSILSFAGALLLLVVPNLVMPKPTLRVPFIKDHTPGNIQQ